MRVSGLSRRAVLGRVVVRWVVGLLLLLLLPLQASPALAWDAFGFLRLPEPPQEAWPEDWTESQSRLRLAQTVEEMYREWRGGTERKRFDGSRLLAGLEYPVWKRFHAVWNRQLQGRQTWRNQRDTSITPFDFTAQEERQDLALRWLGDSCAAEVRQSFFRDEFAGQFRLHEDIIAALGSRPDLTFDNRGRESALRVSARGGSMAARFDVRRGELGHRLWTSGIRMDLEVPLQRSWNSFELETSFRRHRRFVPFLRWYQRHDTGEGDSTKNTRYFFGRSWFDTRITSLGFGLTRRGRRPLFAEYARHRLHADLFEGNNLITLDPLFLFATNQVDDRVTVPESRFWSLRLGGVWRPRRRLEGTLQYRLTSLPLTVVHDRSRVYRLRVFTEGTTETRSYRYQLHQAATTWRRADRHGEWRLDASLLFPREVDKPAKTETGAGAGPVGPPGPAVPADEGRKTIRGGWQLTLERSFRL